MNRARNIDNGDWGTGGHKSTLSIAFLDETYFLSTGSQALMASFLRAPRG